MSTYRARAREAAGWLAGFRQRLVVNLMSNLSVGRVGVWHTCNSCATYVSTRTVRLVVASRHRKPVGPAPQWSEEANMDSSNVPISRVRLASQRGTETVSARRELARVEKGQSLYRVQGWGRAIRDGEGQSTGQFRPRRSTRGATPLRETHERATDRWHWALRRLLDAPRELAATLAAHTDHAVRHPPAHTLLPPLTHS